MPAERSLNVSLPMNCPSNKASILSGDTLKLLNIQGRINCVVNHGQFDMDSFGTGSHFSGLYQ